MTRQHIACVEDLVRPRELLGAFPTPLFTLVSEPIRQATRQHIHFAPGAGIPPTFAPDFDWGTFTRLAFSGGQTSWEELNFSLPLPARQYLRDCIPKNALLLAVEMPAWFSSLCKEFGISYLDMRVSPLRFARDFYIALDTNDAQIYERIRSHAIFQEELSLEAAAVSASVRKLSYDLEKRGQYSFDMDSTLVYLGQTSFDAAIIGPNGRHLRCQDFADRLQSLTAQTAQRLLYKPHPYDEGFAIEERQALEAITGRSIPLCLNNSYQLLGSTASVEFIAISSGLLQEALFFGKPVHWLHKPLVPLAYPDDTRQEGHFLQVHFEDIQSPGFWHQILTPEQPAPRLSRLPMLAPNYGRELLDTWWDYSKHKIWQRTLWIEAFERSGGGLLRSRIEALEKKAQHPNAEEGTTIMGHDFSLHSGERQIATRYEDIRADHRYRYEWIDARLPEGGSGIDAFCGNGYGTWHLSKKRHVWGIDGSVEAIRLAEQHYKTPQAFFSQAFYPFELPTEHFDFAVSLESIEHVENDTGFFACLVQSLKPGGLLFFSTPCEEHLPHAQLSDSFHFHYKHYTFEETAHLALTHGLEIIDWAGQDVYSFLPNGKPTPLPDHAAMQLKKGTTGQFLIFCCMKKDTQKL